MRNVGLSREPFVPFPVEIREGKSLKALGVCPSNGITGSGGDDPGSVKAVAERPVLASPLPGAIFQTSGNPKGTPARAFCRNY